jgi:5'-3' exonuclease/transcription antitermination factor NusG
MTQTQWVILELSPKAEGEDPDILCRSLRHIVRNAEVFVPALVTEKGGDRVIKYLVDGYAFIRREHPDAAYFKLEGSRYVQSIITHPVNGRNPKQIACVTSDDIEKMRSQIRIETNQGISVGDTVVVTSGAYKQIQAVVIEDIVELDSVTVQVKLRSKESLVTLPRSFLKLVSKAKRPAYLDKIANLRAWVTAAVAVVGLKDTSDVLLKHTNFVQLDGWLQRGQALTRLTRTLQTSFDFRPVREQFDHWSRLDAWCSKGVPLANFVRADETSLGIEPLLERHRHAARLQSWVEQGKNLTAFVSIAYTFPSISSVEAKYLEWAWLQDVIGRLRRVDRDVDAVGRVLQVEAGDTVVQNLIIDGHNLAFRCLYAPGMSTLADSMGRPTGILLGFLRSLGSLAKRFPEASLYVTWDGSSQRRRALYSGYKANRGERVAVTGFDQIAWLRGTLPSLGVAQAWNEEEEADDVISALVRGSLKGQRNVILTTDRDMLQLVTETDSVLVPAVASRKEILFNAEAVKAEYGVLPEQMPVLRAFLGDSSDNIPGVPRVPVKVIANLVRVYGGIDGVYSSSLAEVTKYQYARLRESEKQVRLNLSLMRLDLALPFVMLDPDPDQTVARARLQNVEVQPDPILAAFRLRVQPVKSAGSDMRRESNDDERVCHSS